MNKYYISEYDTDMTFLEVRICAYLCCKGRIDKITQIMNYLNTNNFLSVLSLMYDDSIRAENIEEKQDIASLTIDIRDDKFRFKYWNGAKTVWLFHTEDLFKALISERGEYEQLTMKYTDVTKIIDAIKHKYPGDIVGMSYQYYPEDSNVEIIYNLTFAYVVKEQKMENKYISMIYKSITDASDELSDDLKFSISFDFEGQGCSSCEENRLKREAEIQKEVF